jgi:hypothetical protein
MKTKSVLSLFLLPVVCATLAVAQATSNYSPEEAARHIGETATVIGRVDGFHQSSKGNIFLNMGGKFPNQSFTVFIPAASATQFPQAQQYEGRTLAISGKITLYRGKAEIIVNSPSQVSLK